jgi:hypothetical protein
MALVVEGVDFWLIFVGLGIGSQSAAHGNAYHHIWTLA